MSHTQVLDHGFIRLVDSMGDDSSIVQAARVSYGDGSKGEESDKKLIKFLLDHDHGTPFEMVQFKFHVRAPLFVARQWMRHRMGSFNEISARYTEVKDEFYVPEVFRAQDTKNKQGSIQSPDLNDGKSYNAQVYAKSIVLFTNDFLAEKYKELLQMGICREQARMVLPVNIYTQFYWSLNARSLMHFINLRIAPNAQWEIQQYAGALLVEMEQVIPWTAGYFREGLG